jgi:hypothetical protein
MIVHHGSTDSFHEAGRMGINKKQTLKPRLVNQVSRKMLLWGVVLVNKRYDDLFNPKRK